MDSNPPNLTPRAEVWPAGGAAARGRVVRGGVADGAHAALLRRLAAQDRGGARRAGTLFSDVVRLLLNKVVLHLQLHLSCYYKICANSDSFTQVSQKQFYAENQHLCCRCRDANQWGYI